ncbi:MAG: Holliday junction resolvase RuvX [Verrucomicrobiales bacterium]|jgi:putative Holliday junction resolvase|nr:Holliday junction resolvase RuvX [Verrucomicrobiales bacterium]
MSRYLALDYGDKRIGVAISDETLTLASPLPFIANNGSIKKIAGQLRALTVEKNATLIIIGVPRNMDGSYGMSAEKAKKFTAQLRASLTVEIKNVDERLSTVEASRRLHEAGKNSRQQKNLIDSNSACVILQSYLDFPPR